MRWRFLTLGVRLVDVVFDVCPSTFLLYIANWKTGFTPWLVLNNINYWNNLLKAEPKLDWKDTNKFYTLRVFLIIIPNTMSISHISAFIVGLILGLMGTMEYMNLRQGTTYFSGEIQVHRRPMISPPVIYLIILILNINNR